MQPLLLRSALADAQPFERPQLRDLSIFKFGGSVLKSTAHLPVAVSDIYRELRKGRKVIAVVSAFGGHTDQLLDNALKLSCLHDFTHVPRFVSLGEEYSAALLAIAADRAGMRVTMLGVRELGLIASGESNSAHPVDLDARPLLAALAGHEVVVIPGFGGLCSRSGRTVLLGRGGTDMTAIFLAEQLGLERVRLVKDVPGVHPQWPCRSEGAHILPEVLWSEASTLAPGLVQAEALELAEQAGIGIEIASPGEGPGSLIANRRSDPLLKAPRVPKKIAVAGLGVVGGGLVERLLSQPELWTLTSILVRDCGKARVDVPLELIGVDPAAMLATNPEIVVDVTSDGAFGEQLTLTCLQRGISTVSANKQALSKLVEMEELALKSGARLHYSAAVGGSAPMVELIRQARECAPICAFEAVLNGTVNFMLGRIGNGSSFEVALEKARSAGFAEEDPSSDLDGRDASAKVQILAHEAFGAQLQLSEIECETLSADQKNATGCLKQLSSCRLVDGKLEASVKLVDCSEDPLFAGLENEWNALRVLTSDGKDHVTRGRGAGRWATVEAVYADLMDLLLNEVDA